MSVCLCLLALVVPRLASTQSTSYAYTFPVKSINLAQAQPLSFYVSPPVDSYGLFDVHPVHGCVCADGGVVMAGKALESEESSTLRAFAIKLSASGSLVWVWGSAAAGANDAANAVLQLPGGGDLVVAGYRAVGGVNQRSLTRLALSSGVEVWTATWPSASQQMHGAWEMAQLTTDGTAVLLAGLHDSDDKDEFNFKSYGNVVAGTAIVQKLPTSALLGSSPPAASAAAWTYTSSEYFTSKAARPLSDGSMVVLLYSEVQAATLVKLDSAGSVLWGPTDFGALHGEGTDIAISTDGQSILIAGQGDGGISGTLSGRLTQVSLSGAHLWSKSYTSTPYDGTAGASTEADQERVLGNASACGQVRRWMRHRNRGRNGLSGQLAADCAAGTADAGGGLSSSGVGVAVDGLPDGPEWQPAVAAHGSAQGSRRPAPQLNWMGRTE